MSYVKSTLVKEADWGTTPYTPAEHADLEFSAGYVLATGTKDYQVMSDIWETGRWARVWNPDFNKSQIIDWVTNVTVDATPEVKNLFRNEQLTLIAHGILRRREAEAKVIRKGDSVKVVSGRTAKGLVGKAAVIISRSYGQGYHSSMENKVAIPTSNVMVEVRTSNGKTFQNYKDVEWVWERNLEKVNVVPVDLEEVVDEAIKIVDRKLSQVDYGSSPL